MTRSLPILGCALLLTGCAHAPSAPPPSTIPLPTHLAQGAQVNEDAPPAHWWRLYHDTALDALVEEALAGNRDLRAVAAHLLAARAMVQETHGQRLPTTDISMGAGYGSTLQDQIAAAQNGGPIRTGPRFDMGAGLSWEPDLFGRLRAMEKAARADAQGSQAVTDGVRVLLAADVTDAWLSACGHARQAELARQSLALAQQSRDMAGWMQNAGIALPEDVARADALVARSRAAVPPLEAARHDALARLAVLTGHPPDQVPAAASACTRLPVFNAPIPLGDPLSLLLRRPDVRESREALAASTARIGVAVADLYPRIVLGTGAALSSPSLAGLGDRDNLVWRAGPLLSWSFPNTAIARARIRQAKAGQEEALARFDATILRALEEMNRAAADYGAALERQDALRAAAKAGAEAERLARAQRSVGAITAPQALTAARDDLTAQAALAQADLDTAHARTTLFKALGGGWEQAPSPKTQSDQP